jgi:hypothetical protein
LLGGFQTVNDIISRDNIVTQRRDFGMLVYVVVTDEFYQLKTVNSLNLSDNLNWSLVPFGASSNNTDWVNSVISRSNTPPGSPNINDRYLVIIGSGAWIGYDNLIVEWNGTIWVATIPSEGMAVKVDDETNSIYFYEGSYFPFGSWNRKDFVLNPLEILYNIPSVDTINVGTNSEYLIFGNLNVDGQINTWGKVVILNGTISGTGSVGIYGSGSVEQYNLLTEIYGGTGISIATQSPYTRIVSVDLIAGTSISISNSGNSVVISAQQSQDYPKHVIVPGETITIPDYQEYWIYGDLTVYGTLDIGTYGKVVVANGAFVAATGSLVNNMGNVEVYDLLTVADDNLKIDITEIRYGGANRILFESDLKFIPLMGTYARVITESSKFVYSTSSSYTTSTTPLGLENYLGVGTSDPLKKFHVKNSGILIDGIYPEQSLGLGNPNYARFVINTDTGNTQDFLNFRNNLGTVLNVAGGIDGGIRYPSISIGTSSSTGVVSIYDYSGNNLLSLSRVGSFSQTNLTNGFQLVNGMVDFGLTTIELSGSYWDNGSGTYRLTGIAGGGPGGTYGVGSSIYDSNTDLWNQMIVQSDYVYASVSDLTNSIYNSMMIYTHSVVLSYIGLSSYDITLDDIGARLSSIPQYANDSAALSGGLLSGYLYATSSGGVTRLCIVP